MTPAERGWVAVFAGAGALDLWLVRTRRLSLTQTFRRRGWVPAVWAYLTLHLTGALPRRLDPLYWLDR